MRASLPTRPKKRGLRLPTEEPSEYQSSDNQRRICA
jgi:hypothetical protein